MGFVVLVSMGLFFGVNVGYFRERVYSIRHVGIGFVGLNAAAVVVGSMVPLAGEFYGIGMGVVAGLAVGVTLGYVGYARVFRN